MVDRVTLLDEAESGSRQTGWSLRAIPALIGVLALLSLPFSALFALGSTMLFDAPGSERNPLTWLLATLLWASPVVALATIAVAAQTVRSFSSRRLNLLILIPATWWIAYLALQAVSEAFCTGRTVCS
jgi:hypothetical protein